jgi:U3 small nucleolar ribonucleoprotein component
VRADQTYKDPTHDASTYFDAPINEGTKQTVELQSLLAAYKQRKIASAFELSSPSSTKEGASAIAKLTLLSEKAEEAVSRLAEQKKSMGIATSHADFIDFIKQSPAHLNALHAALGAEDEDINALLKRMDVDSVVLAA